MKILVTGATGFVGGHMVPRLLELGHEVYALERHVAGRYSIDSQPRAVVYCDLRDFFSVRNTLAEVQPDIVIHLAAISPVAYSYDHPQEVFSVNTSGTMNLAEACVREVPHLKQFLFAGSSEEYGIQTQFPINENATLRANSPYSASKISADMYLQYLLDAHGFPVTVLRPFNSYGRKHDTHFVVERIVTQLLKSQEVRLGDVSAKRDMIYIDDHVNAYLSCLNNSKAIGQTINFCTGKAVTIEELVNRIGNIMSVKPNILPNVTAQRPLDIPILVGDNAKALNIVNWRPEFSLDEGLKLTVDYWSNKPG